MNDNKIFESPCEFWDYFKEIDRFFFHDPGSGKTFVGAVPAIGSEIGSLYKMSVQTFNGKDGTGVWDSFVSEEVSYKHYQLFSNYSYQENVNYLCSEVTLREDNMDAFYSTYNHAKEAFKTEKLKKVIVSREATYSGKRPNRFGDVLSKLVINNPSAIVFAICKGDKIFFGATPEVLIEKENNEVRTVALAGTIIRTGHNDRFERDSLLLDEKNRYEHILVLESIKEDLKAFGCEIEQERTKVVTLANIHHLKTKLRCKDSEHSLNQWVKLLHPTPAMGGTPKIEALDFIENYEIHDRGLYASPIGLINESGEGKYVVGIRSAIWSERELTVFAGCGIVPSSNFKSEWEESENKMKTILDCVNIRREDE